MIGEKDIAKQNGIIHSPHYEARNNEPVYYILPVSFGALSKEKMESRLVEILRSRLDKQDKTSLGTTSLALGNNDRPEVFCSLPNLFHITSLLKYVRIPFQLWQKVQWEHSPMYMDTQGNPLREPFSWIPLTIKPLCLLWKAKSLLGLQGNKGLDYSEANITGKGKARLLEKTSFRHTFSLSLQRVLWEIYHSKLPLDLHRK